MGLTGRQLGRRVATLRVAAGLTQATLAEHVGVTVETISRLERGKVTPSLERLEDVAGALGVDLGELFRFADRPGRKDQAIERVLALVRRSSIDDIDRVRRIAELVLAGRRKR
jgi:transcriptional regulator with XRE-family HTH domain